MSMVAFSGTGTFHADSYYLPLREFVASSQQDAMETRVIELYNAQQRRMATRSIARDGVTLACLVMARLLLSRVENESDTPKSTI